MGTSQRRIAAAPTEVWAAAVLAGQGPPWCIAQRTATPVGQPFQISAALPEQRPGDLPRLLRVRRVNPVAVSEPLKAVQYGGQLPAGSV